MKALTPFMEAPSHLLAPSVGEDFRYGAGGREHLNSVLPIAQLSLLLSPAGRRTVVPLSLLQPAVYVSSKSTLCPGHPGRCILSSWASAGCELPSPFGEEHLIRTSCAAPHALSTAAFAPQNQGCRAAAEALQPAKPDIIICSSPCLQALVVQGGSVSRRLGHLREGRHRSVSHEATAQEAG